MASALYSFPYRVKSIEIPEKDYYVGDTIDEITGITDNGNLHLYSFVKPQAVFICHEPFIEAKDYEVKAYYKNGHNAEILETSKTITVKKKQPEPVEPDYLTFTTVDKKESVHITPADNWNSTTKEYSTDNGTTWQTYTSGEISGLTVKFRGVGGTLASADHQWKVEPSTIDAVISGNIETVLDYQKVSQGQHPTLDENCFSLMFQGYTEDDISVNLGIKSVKDLVIGSSDITLSKYCCQQMFDNCTGLVDLPKLPALNLAMNCYYRMFEDCTSLKVSETQSTEYAIEFRVPVSGTGVTADNALGKMFKDTGGSFQGAPEINKTYYLFDYEKEIKYLTFTTTDGEETIHITPSDNWNATNKEYSIDNGNTWNAYTSGEIMGLSIKFRGVGGTIAAMNHPWIIGPDAIQVKISGDIETILDYQKVSHGQHPTEIHAMSFAEMFEENQSIVSVKDLIIGTSTTPLMDGCCNRMFGSCSNLKDLPKLPALTLAKDCYSEMFRDCDNLMVSDTKSENYSTEFRVPTTGTGTDADGALSSMFKDTGGEFMGTPEINKTYYISK